MMHVLSTRRRLPLLAALVAVSALSGMALAAAAFADPAPAPSPGPTEATLKVADLRTDLASGPLTGYFKTVVSGTTIVNVACNVTSVVESANYDGSPLIMFEVTDPAVLKAGGVAAGMSGSPLYVDVGAPGPADMKLVGAVSYGDIFTLGGLGLATPIEDMVAMETGYGALPATSSVKLAEPVRTESSGTVDTVVIARNLRTAAALSPQAHTAVVAPLALVEIGGVSPSSRVYKRFAAKLEKRGIDVKPAMGGGGGGGVSTRLVGGASVAAVLARGDVWAAYVGTVTYAHDDVVVSFGHPADWDGDSGMGMANAWVSGIWSSSYRPYKVVSLGAMKGTVTQDRGFGIIGTTSVLPQEVRVDATATLLPQNRTVTDTTYIPVWVAANQWYGSFVAHACFNPIGVVTDAGSFPGNAATAVSMIVSDGVHPDITVQRTNVFDSTWDVGYAAADEIYMMDLVLTDNINGVGGATVKSVDFDATLTATHHAATILDVSVPGGLKTGDNNVTTTLRPYGQSATVTFPSVLNIPAGTPLSGVLMVTRARGTEVQRDPMTLPTLSDLVTEVNAWPHNNELDVTFVPDGYSGGDSSSMPFFMPPRMSAAAPASSPSPTMAPSPAPTTPPKVTMPTTWVVNGGVAKHTTRIMLHSSKPFAPYNGGVRLNGVIVASDAGGTTVAVYKRSLGGAKDVLLAAKVAVVTNAHGQAVFHYKVKGLKRSVKLTVVWDGSRKWLGASRSCMVFVLRK